MPSDPRRRRLRYQILKAHRRCVECERPHPDPHAYCQDCRSDKAALARALRFRVAVTVAVSDTNGSLR